MALAAYHSPKEKQAASLEKRFLCLDPFLFHAGRPWSESLQRSSVTWLGELRDTHGRLGGAAALDHASQASLALSVAKMVPTSHGHTLTITLLLEGAS